MKLTFPNLAKKWIQEEYECPPCATKSDITFYNFGSSEDDDEIQIRIFGFHHGTIYNSFLRFEIKGCLYNRTHGKYLSMEDPKMFDIFKTWLDMSINYRDEWIKEVNEEESEMLLEEIYFDGGYAT
jgi:hypothetical protein